MAQSMTGFARTSHSGDWGSITWELRSVNHRFFDLNMKMPDNFRALEMSLRKHAKAVLGRGGVEAKLSYAPGEQSQLNIQWNTPLFNAIARGVAKVNDVMDGDIAVDPIQYLRWPGLMEFEGIDMTAVSPEVEAGFQEALGALVVARESEGQALSEILHEKNQALRTQVDKVSHIWSKTMHTHQSNLQSKLDALYTQVEPERLAQEVALIVQKADIAEELDRLLTHINAIDALWQQSGPIGRQLDFLIQELNREANTIASKSLVVDISSHSIEMKVIIEQMREQVQNIA